MRLLVDHGGYNNLGDTAMLEAVIHRLRHNFPDAELQVTNRGFESEIWGQPGIRPLPDQMILPWLETTLARLPAYRNTPRLHFRWQSLSARAALLLGPARAPRGLRLAPPAQRHLSQRLLDYCAQFDGLHVAGGDYLRDVYAIELLRKCAFITAFTALKKPVVLTGHQLGPFRHNLFRPALEQTLRQADFVGIRERVHSPGFCKHARLEPSRFELMGDDSLGLSAASGDAAAQLLAQQGLRPRQFLAFNFRMSRVTHGHAAAMQPLAELLDALSERLGLPFLIVPVAQGHWESDRQAALRVAALTRASTVKALPEVDLTPAVAKALLGQAHGAVGASWHFCMFALSQGVPAVCLYGGTYYREKAQALRATWDDDRLALALTGAPPAAAADHIVSVLQDQHLRARLPGAAAQAVRQWQAVFDRRVQAAFGRLVPEALLTVPA